MKEMLKAKGQDGKPSKPKGKPIPALNYRYSSTSGKAGRLYGKLGRQKFQIVPDSGSDITVCTTTLVKKLNLKVEPVKQTKTQTIFGQGNPITRQIKDARIRILGQETPITIKVVEGKGEILLLGKDWWKLYSAIMDMKKSTFSFIVKGKRHVTKITEEKNPKALLNYLTVE